jgi:transglutaminase-like putative cysteine protease
MSRMQVAGIFSILLAISIIMGAYSLVTMPQLEGFADADLHEPGQFTAPALPPLPDVIAGTTMSRPDISVMIYIGQMFEEYGGSVRMEVTNNDTMPMFLEEVAFGWVGGAESFQITVNAKIEAGETYKLKTLAVGGTATGGSHEYQLRMRVLQLRNNQWYRVLGSTDDWVAFTEHNIDVGVLSSSEANDVTSNPKRYFVKVNSLVDFNSEPVAQASANATAGIGAGYNIGKACAIFDWLDSNINYTEDPGGGDTWYSPDETLATLKGDCEDYAMLLAAMVEHAGGTSRIYLTIDHAFAAVYVGNTSDDLANATADVQAYYRTNVTIHAFADETGYWMVADPLGSLHLGGLAVGQSPTEYYGGLWNTTFEETETLYAIDVTGVDMNRPMWFDSNIWMGMILVFGFITIGFLIAAQSEKPMTKTLCHLCAGEIVGDLYVCPHCRTTYHRPCAFSKAYCMTCGKPVQYPPPPPV